MSLVLETLGDYGWWIAGLVLLALEVALPGVYLLFPGIAALIVGMNVFLLSGSGWFGWEEQVVAFIVISGVAVFLGRKWYGIRSETASKAPLNRRTDRLIGRQAVVTEAIVGGRGRIAIEDSWWSVEGPDLAKGSLVRIEGAEGSVLKVRPIEAVQDVRS